MRDMIIEKKDGVTITRSFKSNKEAIRWLLQNCSKEELATSLLERSKDLFRLKNAILDVTKHL